MQEPLVEPERVLARGRYLGVLRQQYRQVLVGNRDDAALVALDADLQALIAEVAGA